MTSFRSSFFYSFAITIVSILGFLFCSFVIFTCFPFVQAVFCVLLQFFKFCFVFWNCQVSLSFKLFLFFCNPYSFPFNFSFLFWCCSCWSFAILRIFPFSSSSFLFFSLRLKCLGSAEQIIHSVRSLPFLPDSSQSKKKKSYPLRHISTFKRK